MDRWVSARGTGYRGQREMRCAIRRTRCVGVALACLALPSRALSESTLHLPVSADTLMHVSRPPSQLVIAPDLLSKLQTLADGLHNEIVLCLSGSARADTARLLSFSMPTPTRSSPAGAAFASCPSGTLATWHNHPQAPPGVRVPRARLESGAADLCQLSSTDIDTTLKEGFYFTVVSVNASVSCWWTLAQVRILERRRTSQE